MLNWEKEGPEALTTAIELNRIKKDRNDVHQPIKKMTVNFFLALTDMERELVSLKIRVEQAKKAL